MRLLMFTDSSAGTAVAAVFALIAFVAALVVAATAYDSVKRRGFRPRQVLTRLSPEYLRTVFRTTVASAGWTVIDDGNPMVAQSSPAAGRRQQIAMHLDTVHLDPDEHGTEVRIAVMRYSRRTIGGTAKARTLRARINAFLKEVQQADQTADIAG